MPRDIYLVYRHVRIAGMLASLFLVGMGLWAADDDPIEARMRKDITYLASDECEGRGVDTQGINKAADYIAAEFQKAGLKPFQQNANYFQPFSISGSAKLETPNTLKLQGPQGQEIELDLNNHFRPLGLSGAGKVSAPLVFAGYGAKAKDIGYDDFKDVDVAGKVVVFIRKVPRADNPNTPFDGNRMNQHQSLQSKVTNAEAHKAAAILIVNDHDTAKQGGDPLMDFAYTATASSKTPTIHVRRSVIDPVLQSSLGSGIRELERDIDSDLKARSAPLTGWTATLETNVRRQQLPVKNIVGVLEGAGPLANETVVIGAHYDHLGYGGFGSLAKDKKPAIHHGADDNGSGSTALMEIARRIGAKKDRQGRRLVFIAFSGEERGLLGSEHYCRNPLYPLADTVAMVNLDMVGRLRADDKTKKDKLIVYGTGTAKTFDSLIDTLNDNKYNFQLQKVPGGMGPSDHASFYMRKIPVFFMFTGDHGDYHRPSDTADKINVAGMRKIADLVTDVVSNLSTVAERPQYVQVASSGKTGGPAGPRIGIRPDYGSDKEGVLLSGVAEGGPAQKAGLKEGDLITEVGGKPAKNLETYMVLMSAFKKGDKVPLTVERDGKKVAITVVPE
jgi:Zn-dependent M28 family amino/carboxypeptidase